MRGAADLDRQQSKASSNTAGIFAILLIQINVYCLPRLLNLSTKVPNNSYSGALGDAIIVPVSATYGELEANSLNCFNENFKDKFSLNHF